MKTMKNTANKKLSPILTGMTFVLFAFVLNR